MLMTLLDRNRLFAASLSLLAGCFPDRLVRPPCAATEFTTSQSVDTTVTSTGLKYLNTKIGAGEVVAWCSNVAIHYDAFLLDGTQFGESRSSGIPLLFSPGVGSLVDGIEQGVIGMRGGGIRRLIIPPHLGYGNEGLKDASGNVIVPGGATMIYDIEVVQVGPPAS